MDTTVYIEMAEIEGLLREELARWETQDEPND